MTPHELAPILDAQQPVRVVTASGKAHDITASTFAFVAGNRLHVVPLTKPGGHRASAEPAIIPIANISAIEPLAGGAA